MDYKLSPPEEYSVDTRDMCRDALLEIQYFLQDEDELIVSNLHKWCEKENTLGGQFVSDVLIDMLHADMMLPMDTFQGRSHYSHAKQIYLLTLYTVDVKFELILDFLDELFEEDHYWEDDLDTGGKDFVMAKVIIESIKKIGE